MLSIRLLKLAMPFTAATDVVLPATNPPGPLTMEMLTIELLFVTTLPNASFTATCSAGVNA